MNKVQQFLEAQQEFYNAAVKLLNIWEKDLPTSNFGDKYPFNVAFDDVVFDIAAWISESKTYNSEPENIYAVTVHPDSKELLMVSFIVKGKTQEEIMADTKSKYPNSRFEITPLGKGFKFQSTI